MFSKLAKSLMTTTALLVVVSQPTIANETGTSEQAKSMLEKVISAMQADPAKAVAAINRGDAEYRLNDLYPYCFENDGLVGKVTAHGRADNVIGVPVKKVKDKNGTIIAGQMIPFAEDGVIKTATYWFPKPNETVPLEKEAYYSKIGVQICAVGYYK
ncbi:MAG: cache domain-containing protein [Leucothrix sp.]